LRLLLQAQIGILQRCANGWFATMSISSAEFPVQGAGYDRK